VAAAIGLLAGVLIVTGLVSSWSAPPSPVEPTAAPATSAAPTGQAASPSGSPGPASTELPYEQLRGQVEALLAVEGPDRAFALLVDAVAASAQVAGFCPRLAADLAQVDPGTDWRSACGQG
jgi:hypothetical protein